MKQKQPNKKKTNSSQEGPGGSYMIGLPKKVTADQKKNMKEASSGPKYKTPPTKMKKY